MLFGPALVMLASGLVVYLGTRHEREMERWVPHTHEVRAELASLIGGLSDAATGQRGYLLTGRTEYLAPYTAARRRLPEHFRVLRANIYDASQQRRLDTLERAARAKLGYLDTTIALRAGGRGADALRMVETGRGQRYIDEARRLSTAMEAREGELLDARIAAAGAAERQVYWLLAGGTALAVLAALLANKTLTDAAAAESAARQALTRAQGALREALAAARTGTWDWDVRTGRVLWSEASGDLVGSAPSSPVADARGLFARAHPDDRASLDAAIVAARDRRSEFTQEFRVVQEGGGIRWMAGRGRFFYDALGAPARAAGTVVDITERKLAEEERGRLQASLRVNETMSAIGAVTAGVSHEVRNPLFGISSVLDALDASFPDRPELRPFVDRLRQQVNRVSDLMADLLEYGKPAMETLAPAPLGSVLTAAIAHCQPLAGTNGVQVRSTFDPATLPVVAMDRPRLVRVFQNLIENALQHTPRGGVVHVSARASGVPDGRGTWVDCVVRDEGSGVPAEHLPRLFEPFFTKRRGGTGLGLSIVQRIVREHGGTIMAENAKARGALLTVRLPTVAAAPLDAEHEVGVGVAVAADGRA